MDTLQINLDGEQTTFLPGSSIAGSIVWHFAARPDGLELRLFWYTEGKGSRDVGIVSTQRWDHPSSSDSARFEFQAPDAPYSYSGRLISILWALELVVDGGKHTERVNLTIGPGAAPVQSTQAASRVDDA